MKALLKQLLGESAIYGISSIITKFIGIFLVPLYTSVFSPADYGVINIINSFFFFVGILVVFALDNSAARWYYDTEDLTDRKKTIASWFWFQLIMTILICSGIIISSSYLSNRFVHSENSYLFIIPSLCVLTGILPTILSNWLRMRRKALHTVIYSISYSMLTIGLTVYFVLITQTGVIGVFYAVLISNIVASLYCIYQLFDWLSFSYFSVPRIREMLKFALPLIPTAIAFWVINSSAAFVIEYFYPLEEVGLFQLGVTIASAVTLFISAFQMAWGPFAYSILNQDNAKKVYSTVLTGYSLFANFLALCVSLFALDLLHFFTTPDYYAAYVVAGILAFNTTIYGYVYIVGLGNGIAKDNKPLAIAVLISATITAILLFTLTPIFGGVGTAIGMLLGNIIIPVYIYISAQKRYFIPFKTKLPLLITVLSFSFYLIYLSLESSSFGFNLLLKLGLITLFFVFSLLLLRIFEPLLFSKLRPLLNRFINK